MFFRTLVFSAVCCMIVISTKSTEAAPLVPPRVITSPQKQAAPPPIPQTVPADRKNLHINTAAGVYFQAGIGITSLGDLTVDLAIPTAPAQKTQPVAVYLRNESTGQISASATIGSSTGRVSYQLKPTDLPAGTAVYSILVGSSMPLNATAMVTFPKTDSTKLNDYLNRLTPQQKQTLTAVLNTPAVPAQKLPATASNAASHAVATENLLPRRRIMPTLERSPTTHFLTQQPVDISSTMEQTAAVQAIPFRPFTLEEVFDLNTGKPLYSRNIDEATGQLKLPHRQGAVITRARPLATQELQQRAIANAELKRSSAVRFGKLDSAPMTVKSRIAFPKHDGSVLEASAEEYLRELNDFEKQLNAIGQTLRDPLTGKIKTTAAQTRLGKTRQNHQLLTMQEKTSAGMLKKNITFQPWDRNFVNTLHSKGAAVGIQKKGRVSANLAPSEVTLQKKQVKAAQPLQAAQSPTASQGTTAAKPGIAGGAATQGLAIGNGATGAIQQLIANDTCIINPNPEGGAQGEQVVLKGERIDRSCTVTFEDINGRKASAQVLGYTSNEITVKVPSGLAGGIGNVTVYSPSANSIVPLASTHHTQPFPIVKECTIASVFPPQGPANTKLTLSVFRFNNCTVALEDKTYARNNLAVTTIDPMTLTVETPNLTLGTAKIMAIRKSEVSQNYPAPLSQVPFKILRSVVDGDGNSPPPDFFAMGIPTFNREYPWEKLYGEPSTFAFGVSAKFAISSKGPADDNLVRFNGDAATTATLYNFPVEIIGAHANASIPSATSNDSKLRADFKVTSAGFTIYKLEKKKDKEDGKEEATCDDKAKDKNGKCCDNKDNNNVCIPDDSAVSINVQYKLEKEFKLLSIDKAVDTHFTIGPVPMVARIGFRGNAGAKVHVALSPIQVIGTAAPYVRTSVYGECAVDLAFATAGIGANMTLANLDINAGGRATLDFGQLAIQTDLYVQYDYDLLSGYLYGFITGFGQRYEKPLFDWTGFKDKGYLLPPQTYTIPLFPS